MVVTVYWVPHNSIQSKHINTPASGRTNFFNPEHGDSTFVRNVRINLQHYTRHSPEQYTMNHPCRDDLKHYNISFFQCKHHPKYISETLCLNRLMVLTCSISRYVYSAAQALSSSVLLLTETRVKTDYR